MPRPRLAILLPLAAGLAACNPPASEDQDPANAKPRAESAEGGGQPDAQDPTGSPAKPPQDPYQNAPIAPSSPHAFGVLDMLGMERISSPTLSPDGSTIAVVNRYTDMREDRGRTDLWLVSVADGSRRRLTNDPSNESSPTWSEDGKSLYFLANRGQGSQVHRINAASEESAENAAQAMTNLALDVTSFRPVPGSVGAFVVSTEVYPDCNGLECSATRLAESGERTDSALVYDKLFVRHWDAWKDGRRSHLIHVDASGTATDLMPELDADCPSKPFGGVEDYDISPDGSTVVFAARMAGTGEPWSTNFDLYQVPATGGSPKQLTQNPAWDAHPVFLADGQTIAYTAMARAGFEADRMVLHTLALGEDAKPVALTQGWDRSVRDFVARPDGTYLLVAQDLGETKLFNLLGTDQEPNVIPGADHGTISSPALVGEEIAFLYDDLSHPAELRMLPSSGGEPRTLAGFNDERIGPVSMGEYEQFSFKGAGGDTVHGWIVKPVDFDETKKYPLAFLIHGGPQGSFGNHFHYRWNPQFYAGLGYAAVMIDFHGSTGYGQAFTDDIRGDWGGKPLEDLKKGLAHATSSYPFIDEDRVCGLGASYGGYMVNWIAGNWPDRFQCLVNHDGIFDQRSMYYSTEELWFPEWEHGGPYYSAPKAYERHNPSTHVTRWKTPMLVVHGLLDHRVPLEQGLATFTALQRQGVESRFLYFPDENHWVLHPHNGKRWHDEVARWLSAHLDAPASP